jgi:hypothetical protein
MSFEEKIHEAHDSLLVALKLAAARKEDFGNIYLVCDFQNDRVITATKENLGGLLEKLSDGLAEASQNLLGMQKVDGFIRVLYFGDGEWTTNYILLPVLYLSGQQTIGIA